MVRMNLMACSTLSAVEKGRNIYEHAIRTGWETDAFVGAGLVDMYARCCVMEFYACCLFSKWAPG